MLELILVVHARAATANYLHKHKCLAVIGWGVAYTPAGGAAHTECLTVIDGGVAYKPAGGAARTKTRSACAQANPKAKLPLLPLA